MMDELSLTELRRVKLVLMDIDGTLVSGSRLELENVRHQLNRLKHYRIQFSIATGRTIFGSRQVLGELDREARVRWIIAYNGGVIGRPDASPWIERLTIDREAYHNLLRACRRLNLNVLAYTCSERFDMVSPEQVFTEPDLFFNPVTEFNGMPVNRVSDLARIPLEDLVAVLVVDPNESGLIEKVAERIQETCGPVLRVTTSGGQYVEIGHPNSTKREAMLNLCNRLDIEPNEVMAIGDNFNDVDMLSACGLGVAVANSPAAVKDASRFVCRHPSAAGVVEILSTLAEACRQVTRYRRIEGGT